MLNYPILMDSHLQIRQSMGGKRHRKCANAYCEKRAICPQVIAFHHVLLLESFDSSPESLFIILKSRTKKRVINAYECSYFVETDI